MNVKATLDGAIGRIVLDHPPLNILTRAVLGSLRDTLDAWAEEPGLRVVVLAAEGRHFSAGADVAEHLPPVYAELIPEVMDTMARVASFPLPVIAAVRGRCLGGGFELALACDVIVAGEGASFGQPEIVLGVTAPAACVLLPRRGVRGAAAEMVFTGDAFSAARALAAGFIERLVPDDQVEAEALALAGRMARHSAVALRATKLSLEAGAGPDLAAALRATGRIYVEDLMRTADAVEGLTAFLEKRTPSWADR